MRSKLAKALAALDRLVNYFIPPEIAVDRDARNRAHVYVVDPAPGYEVAVLAISITAFWIFPFVLRAGASYNPLALVSIQNLIFCILWGCYFYGGVRSPTLARGAEIPR